MSEDGTDHPADQALDEVLDELTGDADVFGAARQGALKMHERWIKHSEPADLPDDTEQFRIGGGVSHPVDAFEMVRWFSQTLREAGEDRFGRRFHVEVEVTIIDQSADADQGGEQP